MIESLKNELKNVVNIVNMLKNTASTNSKIAILKSHKDNEMLKKVLLYAYNDNKYKITKDVIAPYIIEFSAYDNDPFDLLDKLAISNINDELRKEVGLMLGSMEQDIGELFLNIMQKDLRCNISTKTIQKVWKNLIPAWEIQQAYPLEKYKLKPNEWIALSEKLNGIRGTFFMGEIKSRQNKVFTGLQHIIDDIDKLGLDTYVIDGELVRNNVDGLPDNENFRLSTSIINSDATEKPSIIFRIYDILPVNEFLNGESALKYPQRIVKLEALSKHMKDNGVKNIEVLPILYQGNDHSQIEKWLKWADDNGKEGIMLYRDSTYKCKRHSGILKVKSFKHCDVKCTDVYEGEGKYEGALGGIIVDYKGYPCGVGSGFSDEQRLAYWENPKSIIGRVVQIKYKEESKNKQGGISMQFPIFECVREEGKEVSYN